eukprot:5556524-Pleurochrysis_carterae.AAC.2
MGDQLAQVATGACMRFKSCVVGLLHSHARTHADSGTRAALTRRTRARAAPVRLKQARSALAGPRAGRSASAASLPLHSLRGAALPLLRLRDSTQARGRAHAPARAH